MEQNTTDTGSTETGAAAPAPAPAKASYGSVVALVIIMGIIVVGALYLWGERIAEEAPVPMQAEETTEQGSIEAGIDIEAQ